MGSIPHLSEGAAAYASMTPCPSGGDLDAWRALEAGDYDAARTNATESESKALAEGRAAGVVEAASVRALASLASGDAADAVRTARRVSRMARTEEIPEAEYLANLALARTRRATGHPHLATRILTALLKAVPPIWIPGIGWELVMAGAAEIAPAALRSGQSPAGSLLHLWDAVSAKDLAIFRQWVAYIQQQPLPVALRADVLAIVAVTDPDAEDAEVEAWSRGSTHDAPPALHGWLTLPGSAPADETAIAYVYAPAEQRAQRLGRAGWVFGADGQRVLPQSRRRQGRIETLVSALLLASEGTPEASLFEEIYGFAFEPATHRNIFQVLIHRAREWVGDAATIHVENGRAWIDRHEGLLVPDPRCAKPAQDRLLRAVAQHRGATARDIARALGVSLRVAQSALQELAADGACLVQRDGRSVRYLIEDTTFQEPTHAH